MVIHLLAHAFKTASFSATGTKLKAVRCEKCAKEYWYIMGRRARGTATYIALGGKHQGQLRAQAAANKHLQKRLERECELVPCPGCGWVNEDLVRQARRRVWRGAFPTAGVLLFIAVLAVLVSLSVADERNRLHSQTVIFTSEWAGFIVLLAIAILLIRMPMRRRLNPNRGFPNPPAPRPGTPPALIRHGVGLAVADAQYPVLGKYQEWAVLRIGQITFPARCCICLRDTREIYRQRFKVTSQTAVLPVPFCGDCHRLFRPILWTALLLGIVGSIALGSSMWLIPDIDDVVRWVLASLIAFFVGLIAVFIIPALLCRPYRLRTIDRDRGVIGFASKNEEFTQLIREQANRLDAFKAAAQRVP